MTYWVNNSIGSDAFDGTSATVDGGGVGPKATLTSGTGAWDLALVQGDTINIVNTGTPYVISQTRNLAASASLIGTSYSNFGAKIQGTDSSGNPSLTEIYYTSVGASTAISLRSSQNYIIIQGLKINRAHASSTTNTSLTFVNVNKNGAAQCGPVRVQYCIEINTSTKSGRTLIDATGATTSTSSIEYQYCIVQGFGTNAGVALSTSTFREALIHHNIFISNAAGSPVWVNLGSNDDSALVDHRVYNNTFVVTAGNISSCITSSDSAIASGTPQKHFYNNLFVALSASTDSFLVGNAAWEGVAWTGGTKVIGNNVFVRTAGSWSAGQPYQVPWDEDNTDAAGEPDYWTTDTTGVVDPFNDSGTAFDWDANGAGWDLPLPGDYRLVLHRTAGVSGAVPGAIVDSVADIDGPTTLTIYATTGQAVTENIDISNVGGGTLTISSIVLVSGDASLTYGGPASDTISAAATTSYPVTFLPTTHPTDVTATLTFTSDDADEPTHVVTITARSVANFTPGGPPLGEDNPGYYLPPFSGVTASIELRKNTTFWARLMAEVGDSADLAVGITAGTVNLVTSSGLVALAGLTLTGLNKLFIMVDGGTVNLRVGSSDHVLLDGGCLMLANTSNLSTVLMENVSTIREVEVHFFGSKGA